MIGVQTSICDFSLLRNASGVGCSAGTDSVPSSAKRVLMLGSLSAVCSAADSLSITGFGVPFGAYSPCHAATSKPGNPDSCIVGTSGSDATRLGVVTAYTLILPALIWPVVLVVWSHMKST